MRHAFHLLAVGVLTTLGAADAALAAGPGAGNGPRVANSRVANSRVALANPASVNCVNRGGRLRIVSTPGGQIGLCTWPSGKTCEEWALFRGQCTPPKARRKPARR